MRRFTALLFLLLPATATPIAAQRADSAAAARRLVRAAASLLARGDSAAAFDSLLGATRAWPMQGAYQVMAARLAAATGRDSAAIGLLAGLNASGYAWDTAAAAYDRLRPGAAFRSLADGSVANQATMANSEVFRILPDERLHPEAVAFDPRTGRVFVTSVRQRKVIVLEPDGRVHDFAGGERVPLDAVLGAAVDTARQRLWIATSPVPEQEGTAAGPAAVVALDLRDGTERGRWTVPDDSAGHVLGEVTLAPDGTVFATDSRSPVIYRVPGNGSTAKRLEASGWHHRDWTSLQGLAFSPGGEEAWVADWTTGLYHIDLARGAVSPVVGEAASYLLGIDDLLWVGDHRLVGIQNGIVPARIISLDLDAAGTTVTRLEVRDRHLPVADEPSAGTLVPGGLLYVANAPWGHYRADGTPDPGNPFPPPVLLRLPLP